MQTIHRYHLERPRPVSTRVFLPGYTAQPFPPSFVNRPQLDTTFNVLKVMHRQCLNPSAIEFPVF